MMTRPFGHDIAHEVFIAAKPERVFDTITSAREWDAFFTNGMELQPQPGGKMVFRWKDWGPDFYTTEATCEIVTVDRPRLFAFRWWAVDQDHPTTVEFHLTPDYGGTVIRLREHGYPDTDKGRAMILECAAGWGEALALLKFYLEKGVTYEPPRKNL